LFSDEFSAGHKKEGGGMNFWFALKLHKLVLVSTSKEYLSIIILQNISFFWIEIQ